MSELPLVCLAFSGVVSVLAATLLVLQHRQFVRIREADAEARDREWTRMAAELRMARQHVSESHNLLVAARQPTRPVGVVGGPAADGPLARMVARGALPDEVLAREEG